MKFQIEVKIDIKHKNMVLSSKHEIDILLS